MKNDWTTTVGLGALLVWGLLGCTGSTTDGSDAPACDGEDCELLTQEEHEGMLGELGVDLAPDAPTDPNGEPLGEGTNPLGSPVTSLTKINELFFAGLGMPGVDGGDRIGLLDDGSADTASLLGEQEDPWVGSPRQAVAADLDGDGIDEIAFVAVVDSDAGDTRLLARILRRDGEALELGEPQTVASFPTSPIDLSHFYNGYHQIDAAAADLDGDGTDDLFVSVGTELLQLTADESGFRLVDRRTFADPGGDPNAWVYVRLAAGDLELNGRDQLVIAWSAFYSEYRSIAEYAIVADDLRNEIASGSVLKTMNGLRQLVTASPCIADLDGDDVPEIAFVGRSYTSEVDGMVVLVMDGSKAALPYELRPIHMDLPQHTALYGVAAADLFGDRTDELMVGRTILRLDAGGALAVVRDDLPVMPQSLDTIGGDFTGDERDDFVFVNGAGGGGEPAGYVVRGFSVVHVDSSFELQVVDTVAPAAPDAYPTLALANVDEDSAVVRYVGQELQFGDPIVIAAIAAPPTFAGSGQSEGGTAFGRSTETEVADEQSFGVSASLSLGFELQDPITQSKLGLKATIEGALGWSTSHSRTIERTVSFATGPEEDKVVFTAVPYDVYLYEIVHSPNAEAIGSRAAVAVPRPPQTLSVSREYYNERVRGQVAPIDDRVFTHEIGRPFSYPSRSALEARMATGPCLYSEPATVGVGTGSTTVTVSRSEGVGEGHSRDLAITIQATMGVGGFVAEETRGISFGSEYTVTNTTGTFYEGTVGDIPSARIDELGLYEFGLFAYPQMHAGREMMVVSYWVAE